RNHLDDIGYLHDVEQRGHSRHEILPCSGRRRHDRIVGGGERDDQRCGRLGQHVLVGGTVGEQHLLDSIELSGGLRDGASALAGNQDVHVTAELLRCGEGLVGRVLERLVVVLGDEEGGHLIPPTSHVTQ